MEVKHPEIEVELVGQDGKHRYRVQLDEYRVPRAELRLVEEVAPNAV